MNENYIKFNTELQKQYAYLYDNDPDYAYAKKNNSPEVLADKMTKSLSVGQANKDGKGIKNTCKVLGVKYTYKAIQEYLTQQPRSTKDSSF